VLLVVSEASKLGISGAAVYAGFFGVANGVGYVAGGKICDYSSARGFGRKTPYIVSCLIVAALVLALAAYIGGGGGDVLVLGILIFCIGVPFAAMQTVHMTFTSDLAPPKLMGQAFGMWNLVAEVGAVISPVLSGTIRDLTGSWTEAIVLNGALLVVSAFLVFLVRR